MTAEPQKMIHLFSVYLLLCCCFPPSSANGMGAVKGELKRWHKITIDFNGPSTSETANPNPFTDFRLDVTFTHPLSGKSFVVPGYYSADGDAANTSSTSGSVWRVHFAPEEIGQWNYIASFRSGTNVAMSENLNAGSSAGFFDGEQGLFTVTETDKSGRDFRGRGRLDYVGQHYLQFQGDGEYFIKQGTDSPENLLAYVDFDGPFASDSRNDDLIKDWSPHLGDFNAGDPTWSGGKGQGLIGALNYLASEEMNAVSFLTMNINGDDRNVFPYLNYNERFRMDVSRLDQWEIVFSHADHVGLFLHFKTQETENDQLLDGGALGNQRRLYYRELIARFSHHLALNWNLGEENTNTDAQRKQFAQFFHENDPYQHHIVLHTYGNNQNSVYPSLLGNQSEYTGASLQTSNENFSQVFEETLMWVRESADAGQKWAVAVDEPGDPQHALRPDNDAGESHVNGRKNALWGTLMAGGWGNEYYFGYGHAHSDLTLQDFRSRDHWWDVCRHAMKFFNENEIPFWEMENDNSISSNPGDYGFCKPGDTYIVYLRNGVSTVLDLTGVGGLYDVRWYDPRNGGELQVGQIPVVLGGGHQIVGLPPNEPEEDWVVLVTRRMDSGNNEPPVVEIVDVTPLDTGGDDSFQEDNGLVVIEIESRPAVDGWQLQTDVPGFTGSGYFRWEGPNLFGNPGAQGVIEYPINITNPGLYQMRFRNHRNGGIPFDQENDIWTRMDSGPWTKVFSGQQGIWNWASNFDFGKGNRPPASYQLSKGKHMFTISGRSQGFRVDRVVFFNTALIPTGQAQSTDNPQSPTGGSEKGLSFELSGSVSDDGQVLFVPDLQWSVIDGPGFADFSDPNSATSDVTFSEPGSYELQLCADDGEFEVCDSRIVVTDGPVEELVFLPSDDAFVENTNGINDSYLKVQQSGPSRVVYLKFNVVGIGNAKVEEATLRMFVVQDPGNGTLNLFAGSNSNWNEDTLSSANAPTNGMLLDSTGGTYSLGQMVQFDVADSIYGDGAYTYIMRHGGGNDVWFSSSEGSKTPELEITVQNTLLGDVNCDGAVDLLDIQPLVDLLASGSYSVKADFNQDGEVTLLDVNLFVEALTMQP